ncbi:MAG TPA: hypothetical protein VHM19_14460 [Polyangiales bacterium]|nr:hypothetical protein [Polyangiales bacterium]
MSNQRLTFASWLCALQVLCAAAVGCGEQDAAARQQTTLLTSPVALRDRLVFVDTTGHRAFLFDAAPKEPEARAQQIDLPYGPTSAERRNGTGKDKIEALVLCAGRRSSASEEAEHAALAAVERDGTVRKYDLGATPFDELVQSDDGRYAVLFRSDKSDDRLLNNANELAIVDLDAKPSSDAAVTHKTPPSFGHTPSGAVFSPTMRVAGVDRRLLIVLSAAEVTIIDLDHAADRRETIVQLGGATNQSVNPVQVLFGQDEATLYIRGTGSDDIYVFHLEAHENPGGNDFRPFINQLSGGLDPADMALVGSGDARRLLVVAQASNQALIVDPSSAKSTAITLPIAPSHVQLFEAASPKDAEARTRALIYGDNDDAITFLDLDDIEAKKARNLEVLQLTSTISSTIPLLDEGKMVLMQGAMGVSVLDLAQRTVAPISSNHELKDALFDPKHERLWVGPSSQPWIDTLDLQDGAGATHDVLLDSNVQQLVPLWDIDKVVVLHDSRVGYLTLIDARDPSRDTAKSVRGFLIAGALDRGAP